MTVSECPYLVVSDAISLEMMDIASQLVLKWARIGPDHPIHPIEDFTRLTIDTIAL